MPPHALAGDPTHLTVRIAGAADHRRITVSGELDALAAPLLDELLRDALTDPGVTALHLDLRDVTFLGAAGVRSLALGRELARRADSTFRVHCGSRRAVLYPLQVTGLLALLATDRQA